MTKTSVHAMLFLESRPMDDRHGTLLVALSTGMIQVFSHHPQAPGYVESFNAIHMAGDAIISMTTDRANRYLLTGTSLGYIKTWLICNFWCGPDVCVCFSLMFDRPLFSVPKDEVQHINMPELRIQFPFMIVDKWMGRAKRTVRGQPNPLLVNSFKAHTAAVTSLILLEAPKLLMRFAPLRPVSLIPECAAH